MAVPVDVQDTKLIRLMLEAYYIKHGYVKLTLTELRSIPFKYALRLKVVFEELDKIAKEEMKRRMK